MIYLALPVGSNFGWGVLGKNLAIEMAHLAPIRLLAPEISSVSVSDELDWHALSQVYPSQNDMRRLFEMLQVQRVQLDGPLLMTIVDLSMRPSQPNLSGTRTVGYTFFEEMLNEREAVQMAQRFFQHIAAGSTWCESALRQAGLTDVSTVLQGIDPTLFEPTQVERRYLRDQFVIFSGGKLELRKGQDLVVRAFKILHDKYRDVLLVTAWGNMWRYSLETMRTSPHVRFTATTDNHQKMMQHFLSENGIDVGRTINLPFLPNTAMARIYKQTDMGLFPNRCEGGTNLVMMEYMACGKQLMLGATRTRKASLTSRGRESFSQEQLLIQESSVREKES